MTGGATSDLLDRQFAALADARRRGILEMLSSGPRAVSDIARPLDMGLPSAVKHLAVMEGAGLVRSEKSGRVRIFALDEAGLDGFRAWLDARTAAVARGYDRLDAWLEQEE